MIGVSKKGEMRGKVGKLIWRIWSAYTKRTAKNLGNGYIIMLGRRKKDN